MKQGTKIVDLLTHRTGIFSCYVRGGNTASVYWHDTKRFGRLSVERMRVKRRTYTAPVEPELTAAQQRIAVSLNLTPTQVLDALGVCTGCKKGCER